MVVHPPLVRVVPPQRRGDDERWMGSAVESVDDRMNVYIVNVLPIPTTVVTMATVTAVTVIVMVVIAVVTAKVLTSTSTCTCTCTHA